MPFSSSAPAPPADSDGTSAATLARSAEQAVRIAAMLHRMGDPRRGRDGVEETAERVLVGEARLLAFEHLAARPASAACVVLAESLQAEPVAPTVVARRVRELVRDARALARPAGRTPSGDVLTRSTGAREVAPRYEPPVWRRLDEPLARLESRGLARLTVASDGGLHYRLEAAGIDWLETVGYPQSRVAGVASRVGEALREMAPDFCAEVDPLASLFALDDRLQAFAIDESLPPGAPVVRRFFRSVLGEGLDRP